MVTAARCVVTRLWDGRFSSPLGARGSGGRVVWVAGSAGRGTRGVSGGSGPIGYRDRGLATGFVEWPVDKPGTQSTMGGRHRPPGRLTYRVCRPRPRRRRHLGSGGRARGSGGGGSGGAGQGMCRLTRAESGRWARFSGLTRKSDPANQDLSGEGPAGGPRPPRPSAAGRPTDRLRSPRRDRQDPRRHPPRRSWSITSDEVNRTRRDTSCTKVSCRATGGDARRPTDRPDPAPTGSPAGDRPRRTGWCRVRRRARG